MSKTCHSAATPIRILVVDDEPSICRFVQAVLEKSGYRITTAASGADAMAAFTREGAPDLLLTDLKMPQMDGDELAAKLRQQIPDLKVLYLTGFSDRLFKEKVTLWADEAFLDKPCSAQGLRQAVSLLLLGRFEVPLETSRTA